MGRAADLALLYEQLVSRAPDSQADDQVELIRWCLVRPELITVDCSLVFCVHINRPLGNILDEPGLGLQRNARGPPTVWFRGQRPYLVHGFGNTDMDPVILRLGYPMSEDDRRRRRIRRLQAMRGKVWHYSTTIFLVPLLLALLLLLGVLLYLYLNWPRAYDVRRKHATTG